MSMQDICASRFPQFDEKLGNAVAVLAPARTGEPQGRMPASSTAISEIDRKEWQGWAEDRLVEAQRYMDATMGESGQAPVRAELSQIATDLVSFHGYAGQGKVDRMVLTLERMQGHSAKARGLACNRAQTEARR